MSYINCVDHPRHGRVWYVVRLRNWRCLGRDAEYNRTRGPLFELEVPGTLVCSGGATLEEAERHLWDLLGDSEVLPRWHWRDRMNYLRICLLWRLRHPLRTIRFWLTDWTREVRIPRR